MSALLGLLSTVAIAAGVVFFVAGTVGLLRFPDALTRLHALTKADNLGLGLIVLGLLPYAGSLGAALKLVVIWALVQFAGEQALRLRVEPLQYALGEEDITAPEQEAFLDQMIKLMKDRKGAELKACGVSVVKDISEDKTYKSLTEDEKAELLELANQRAESLKRYLVDNGIQSSRVFLCSPSIEDDNNAAPHVTFTF